MSIQIFQFEIMRNEMQANQHKRTEVEKKWYQNEMMSVEIVGVEVHFFFQLQKEE